MAAKHYQPSARSQDVRAEDVNWEVSDGQMVYYQLVVSDGEEAETIQNVIGAAVQFWKRMLKGAGLASDAELADTPFRM